MVFVTAVRDYIDWINSSFDAFGQDMNLVQLVQQTALYLVQSCKVGLLYIFTLQWLRDFAYLPILIPKYTTALYKEAFFLTDNPSFNIFTFGETPTLLQNKFFVGFFNSLFTCLPFSCAHLVALRRFYLQGWPAAFATSVGIITGHVFFLVTVLFGWRALLFPWLHFEPWNYLVGLTIILNIAYNMSQASGVAQYRVIKKEFFGVFLSMGLAAFLLTLSEQGVIFQHLTTFTIGLEPSFMEPLTGTSSNNLLLQHSIYILGFIIGSLLFTYLSYWAALGFRFIITQIFLITQVRFHAYYQQFSRYLIIGITLTTIPFYGVDYFITNPLGFVPYDTAHKPGIFAPNTVMDLTLKKSGGEITEGQVFPPEDQSLAGFDRGMYMRYMPGKNNLDANLPNIFGTDEDYYIPVEYAWLTEAKRRPELRPDMIRRHKKTLERFYVWLEQTAPEGAFTTRADLNQAKKERQQRERAEEAQNVAERAKRREIWVPEQFNQFKILDHYTFNRDPYGFHPEKDEIQALYATTGRLMQGADFEEILEVEPTLKALVKEEKTKRDAGQFEVLFTPQSRTTASKYSILHNYQEDVQKHIFEGIDRAAGNKRRSDLTYLWIWPSINSFAPEESQEKMGPVHAVFRGPKQRKAQTMFYSSLVYKTLLRTDIDAFLNRQPKHHLLTPNEEAELYFKRTMLSDYYNSLRAYKNMEDSEEFLAAYGGTKSFAHKVYNHQFKGTYRVARRLFAVDLSPENHPEFPESRERVMKYDQPLYDETKSHNPMLHEELQQRRADLELKAKKSKKVRQVLREKRLPFFRSTNNRPFYCGWDDSTRQFVLTNRYRPRIFAGFNMSARKDERDLRDMYKLAEEQPNVRKLYKLNKEPRKSRNLTKQILREFKNDEPDSKSVFFTLWPLHEWSERQTASDPDENTRRLVLNTTRREQLDLKNSNDRELFYHFYPPKSLKEEKELEIVSELYNDEITETNILDIKPSEWRFREWPSGMKTEQIGAHPGWWYKERPPVPFADRGGFVWPGHEKLKIDEKVIPPTVRPLIERAKTFYYEYWAK